MDEHVILILLNQRKENDHHTTPRPTAWFWSCLFHSVICVWDFVVIVGCIPVLDITTVTTDPWCNLHLPSIHHSLSISVHVYTHSHTDVSLSGGALTMSHCQVAPPLCLIVRWRPHYVSLSCGAPTMSHCQVAPSLSHCLVAPPLCLIVRWRPHYVSLGTKVYLDNRASLKIPSSI